MYEIARSEMTLEILQSFHKMAIHLSQQGRVLTGIMDDVVNDDDLPRHMVPQGINESQEMLMN